MFYEWDTRKEKENFQKHGLSLADGISALEDPDAEFWIDYRYDYGEERTITVGLGLRGILYVVTTEVAEEITRIISVRKADSYEKEWYGQGRS
jgi:uncharacterized protein